MITKQFEYLWLYYQITTEVEITPEQYPTYAIPANEIPAPTPTQELASIKIYNYTNNNDCNIYQVPYDLDYRLLGLYKKETYTKWELFKVEYYWDYDMNTKIFSDLIVKEDYTYIKDWAWYTQIRDIVISWYDTSNQVAWTKTTKRIYTMNEALLLGEARRNTIINDTKIKCIWSIRATEYDSNPADFPLAEEVWKVFLAWCINEVSLYIQWERQSLISYITNATDEWLDNLVAPSITIRMLLIDNLTY